MTISCHVLDTTLGAPAQGIAVELHQLSADATWEAVGAGSTDGDGRASDLLGGRTLAEGQYRITFETLSYFAGKATAAFYPKVEVTFLTRAGEHYHIPLLLSPFGYSTYRGS